MTYKFMFKEPIYSIEDENAESWFTNSYLAVDDNNRDYEEVDRDYQRIYKVKLLFKSQLITRDVDNETRPYEFIAGVEFENEAEAVLFALRWS